MVERSLSDGGIFPDRCSGAGLGIANKKGKKSKVASAKMQAIVHRQCAWFSAQVVDKHHQNPTSSKEVWFQQTKNANGEIKDRTLAYEVSLLPSICDQVCNQFIGQNTDL
jgi:hypothetical protein